jgi:hypothetical protein
VKSQIFVALMIAHARDIAGEEMEFLHDSRETVPAVAVQFAARQAELLLFEIKAMHDA